MSSLTILTITHGRSWALRCYLESLVKADRFNDISVFILLNGVDEVSAAVLHEYAHKHTNIRFVQTPRYSKGKARNVLMAHSQDCDIFYFLDDDCLVAKDTLSVLMDMVKGYVDFDCFGGPNLTAFDDTGFAQLQGYALGSFFGTLWVRDRYRVHGVPRMVDESGLILCNLAVRRKTLNRVGLSFDETLICAEENLLIRDLISAGSRCLHIPGLCVYHERRKTMGDLFRQVFIYGVGKCQVVQKRTFSVWSMRMALISAMAVLGILFLPVTCRVLVGLGCFYIVLACGVSVRIAMALRTAGVFWRLLPIFFVIHAGYVFGFIWGILRAPCKDFIVER